MIEGLLVIDKEPGWTSHDVVARVRRILGERRVGHAGTLDPMATGVLPLGIGRATRVIEYLSEADKAYRATVRLGVSTDTDDAEGTPIAVRDAGTITVEAAVTALLAFRGPQQQIPPQYSAIKRDGVPMYKHARAGRELAIEPRRVTITDITVVDASLPELTFDVACSKGTYIRALARDLGERLGCGAHLTALRRTRSGPFSVAEALSLDAVAEAASAGSLGALVLPPDVALTRAPALILSTAAERRIVTGQTIAVDAGASTGIARAYGSDGAFLAVLSSAEPGVWQPEKVFA